MKSKNIFEELKETASRIGISIRSESGAFKSGYCILHDSKMIVFNRKTPIETKSAVIAQCLLDSDIDGIYLKPAIRDYIENEKELAELNKNNFMLEVNY